MKSFLLYCILLFSLYSYAQQLPYWGVPYLDIYTPEDYENAGKVWDIKSAKNGVVFLASDKGLLEFDGVFWKKYKGSKGFTRSVYIQDNETLYTGSDLDFGKWELDKHLDYKYTSLYPFKENVDQITEEFWSVHEIQGSIVFVSFNNIYVYKNNQLTKIAAPHRFNKSFYINEKLYIVDEETGVYTFDGVSLNLVFSYPEELQIKIVGLSFTNDSLVVVTQNNGIYKYSGGQLAPCFNGLSTLLIKDKTFCFTTINESYFVFGTILNGIYISDSNGTIIQHINKQRGLTNNTILDLHFSKNGMLWASLDLGVVGIHLVNNLSYVFDHNGEFGTGQTALIVDDVLYLGTNQGLYTSTWSNFKNDVKGISFSIIPESAGQVWDLSIINGRVICGHDKGLFEVAGKQLNLINDEIGVLDITPIGQQHLLAGTYNGIHLYQKVNDGWEFKHKLDLIKGACNQIVLENENTIWINLPNYGVIKASLNKDYNVEERTIFKQEDFQEEILHIEKGSSSINILTAKNKFTYDSKIRGLLKNGHYQVPNIVKHRLPNNHSPILLNDTFLFYPIYNGFATKKLHNQIPVFKGDTLLVRNFEIFNRDSSLTYSALEDIPFAFNNVRLSVLIPHREKALYRYYLENYNGKWSEWSNSPTFDLVNLKEGEYKLKLEGKLPNNKVVASKFIININPPWYRSFPAYLAYGFCFLLFIYSLYLWHKANLAKQKKKLLLQEQNSLKLQAEVYKKQAYLHKQEELELEKSTLEKELRKTKVELVKKAKEDEEKNKTIKTLNEKLKQIQTAEPPDSAKVKELLRIIEQSPGSENNTFQIHMDELNQTYTHKLKTLFPSLTMYDLRLCTYIKTGLSTREIAEIMNVLPSSINVSRSRVRKKLNIDAKTDLFTFLDGLKEE